MKVLLQSFSFKRKTRWHNRGILLLGAALLSSRDVAGAVDVKILQSDFFDDLDEVVREIAAYEPDLVAFSVFLWSVELTERLIAACSGLARKPVILCGGAGLSGRELSFMENNPGVDVVVRGAGEAAFVELVRHFAGRPGARRLQDIAGHHYRLADNRIGRSADGAGRMPLWRIPSPYLTGLYRPGRDEYIAIETERYCPFRCSYCSWAQSRRKEPESRFQLERVQAEIEWAARSGYRDIDIIDAAINYDSERFIRVLDILDRHGKDFQTFFFFLKLDCMDERQLARLRAFKKPACLFLGVESFSPAALRLARRPNSLSALKPILDRLSRRSNLRIMAGLVLGLPGDDLKTFWNAVDFLYGYPKLHIRVSLLALPVGTEIRRNAEKFGILFRKTGIPYIVSSEAFPSGDMRQAQRRIGALCDREGRISLNTLQVPLRRISNPRVLPAALRAKTPSDRWVAASILALGDGAAEVSGVHPGLSW